MDRLDIEYIRIEIDSYTDNENGKRRMKENCNSANPMKKIYFVSEKAVSSIADVL